MARGRKGVSISARTYLKLRAYCELHRVPMAKVVERVLEPVLAPIEAEDLLDPKVAGGRQ